MGAPQTLPADFQGWDKTAPPATLPANFDKWDAAKTEAPSAGARLRDNFLQGLGVTDNESAKNFFTHPVDTMINSIQAQGQLAVKAKEAAQKGDYKGALMYGLNYLVPFIGQQTAKAGEQLNEGDIAGGIGRTLGVAAPIIAGSPAAASTRAAVSDTASSALKSVKPVAGKVAGMAADVVDPEITGIVSPRLAHVQRVLGKFSDAIEKSQALHKDMQEIDEPGVYPGAPQPTASPELLQGNALAKGAQPVIDPAKGLGQIPVKSPPTATPTTEAAPTPTATENAAQTAAKRAPRGAAAAAQNFKAIQQAQALREPTQSVVDQVIPPSVNKGENAMAQAQVDAALKNGDVAAAEKVLETRAKNAGIEWSAKPATEPAPSEFPPERPITRGTTNAIRDQLPANKAAARMDQLDTRGIQQEMAQNLERHGQMAESDARKEFIARNSTGTTKGQLIKDSQIADPNDDLTAILRKSVEAARKGKGIQPSN